MQILSDQFSLRFGPLEEGSTSKSWHPLVGYTCGKLLTVIMAAVPPDLSLKAHNSVFPRISLVPLKLPPLPQRRDECLQVSEFMCRPFKNVSEFPAAYHLAKLDRQSPQ